MKHLRLILALFSGLSLVAGCAQRPGPPPVGTTFVRSEGKQPADPLAGPPVVTAKSWAIANGDKETGVTLHWVDEKFDTGDILLQEVIPLQPGDTITSLAYESAQVGAEMLIRGLDLIEAGDPPRTMQDNSQATYYSWPRPPDQRRFRQRGGDYGTIFELIRYM